MSIKMRPYDPECDFLRIRDFLSESYARVGRPLNWRIERWNYARYFVAPMLGTYGEPVPRTEDSLRAIAQWETLMVVWETAVGEIVGVVNIEHPHVDHRDYGEMFLQRHPDYGQLLPEMLDFGEQRLLNPATGMVHIYVYESDAALQALLRRRSYRHLAEHIGYDSVLTIGDLPAPDLPQEFTLRSMADVNDIERRREVFGRSFNHPDPADWPSAFSYEELQRAPDYRPDLDLAIVAPDGRFAACCITWYDGRNRLGILEPVGTIPDFRGMGLGREVVMAGVRRAASLGAQTVQVGSGQRFYEALGFVKTYAASRWEKQVAEPTGQGREL